MNGETILRCLLCLWLATIALATGSKESDSQEVADSSEFTPIGNALPLFEDVPFESFESIQRPEAEVRDLRRYEDLLKDRFGSAELGAISQTTAAAGKSTKGTKSNITPSPYFMSPFSCPKSCVSLPVSPNPDLGTDDAHSTEENIQTCNAENEHQMLLLHQNHNLFKIESLANLEDCLGPPMVDGDISCSGGKVGFVPCDHPASNWFFYGGLFLSSYCWSQHGSSSVMTANEGCSEMYLSDSMASTDGGSEPILRSQTMMLTEKEFIESILPAASTDDVDDDDDDSGDGEGGTVFFGTPVQLNIEFPEGSELEYLTSGAVSAPKARCEFDGNKLINDAPDGFFEEDAARMWCKFKVTFPDGNDCTCQVITSLEALLPVPPLLPWSNIYRYFSQGCECLRITRCYGDSCPGDGNTGEWPCGGTGCTFPPQVTLTVESS